MIADFDEDHPVRAMTLTLVALATASAELAIAGPERSPSTSLARSAALFVGALMIHLWIGRSSTLDPKARGATASGGRPRGRIATRPLVVVALLGLITLPFAVEGLRLAWSGRTESLEIVLVAGLRNLGLGLAVLARRPAFARLAALVSLFLVLVASSLGDGAAVLGTLGLYAVAGAVWLALSYWRRLNLPDHRGGQRRFPAATLVLALGLVGGGVGLTAVGPTRAATVLAGLMPSSGGTDWDNPDARGGVNDGENEVKGSENPQSIGFTDTDVYLESDRPSLYDAFSETYGEPIKPKQQDRMVALTNENVIEQKDRPAENLRAGRQFSAVRQANDRPDRRPGDRDAEALLYVKGSTPLHLGLAAYDKFDGRVWHEEPTCTMACPLVLESVKAPWFRLDGLVSPLFGGTTVAHQIKVGTLDSGPLPVPPHLSRFRIGQVNRSDFFGWSHEGMMRMVGRTVPSGTVIDAESRTLDPTRLHALMFPPHFHAASRHQTLATEHGNDPQVDALALSWSSTSSRGWGQVSAVVQHLREHATHDRGAAVPPDSNDVVADFLLRSRRGPDYLFATSAAMLLRSLDYPTRLVSGFYADPARYDPRTHHTPVTRSDVHVWAEVRLPNGTWAAIEPTPGYELMGPSRSWLDQARVAAGIAGRWARSHASVLILVAGAIATMVWFRRELADALATLVWRLRGTLNPRRCAVEALRLVEKRSSWAGRPRPPGRTPRRWYGPLASFTDAPETDLLLLIRLAEWGLYAPTDADPPTLQPGDDPRAACRLAVGHWTRRRIRNQAPSPTFKELAI